MGYDVSLRCPCCKRSVSIEPHQEGSCVAIGGCPDAEMGVTYNYHPQFMRAIAGGLRGLNGDTGEKSIKTLDRAVRMLGTERDTDYWKATDGNAGHILNVMLGWARQHPTAVWEIH